MGGYSLIFACDIMVHKKIKYSVVSKLLFQYVGSFCVDVADLTRRSDAVKTHLSMLKVIHPVVVNGKWCS